MAITHTFVSGIADGTDSTLVRPSNWNAVHTYDLDMFGVLDASAWVVASDAPAKIKAYATFLQSTISYPVWVCDGVADDVQIQAAVDALPAGGGPIQVSMGTLTFAAKVTKLGGSNRGINIRGMGREATVIISTAFSDYAFDFPADCNFGGITDMTIRGKYGIAHRGGSYNNYARLYLEGDGTASSVGLLLDDVATNNTYWNKFEDILIENFITGFKATATTGAPNKNIVINVKVANSSVRAGSKGFWIEKGAYIELDNAAATLCATGYDIDAHDTISTNSYSESNTVGYDFSGNYARFRMAHSVSDGTTKADTGTRNEFEDASGQVNYAYITGNLDAWGLLRYSSFPTVTIAAGVITPIAGTHAVDTEGAAAADNLDTITAKSAGVRLSLRAVSSARVTTVRHNVGNIKTKTAANFDLSVDRVDDFYSTDGVQWVEVGR